MYESVAQVSALLHYILVFCFRSSRYILTQVVNLLIIYRILCLTVFDEIELYNMQ